MWSPSGRSRGFSEWAIWTLRLWASFQRGADPINSPVDHAEGDHMGRPYAEQKPTASHATRGRADPESSAGVAVSADPPTRFPWPEYRNGVSWVRVGATLVVAL